MSGEFLSFHHFFFMMITTTGPAHVNLAALGQIGLNINTWGHGQLINKK